MRRSRFTEDQIIGILKEHEAGLGAKDLCRKHGVSEATFYKWRSRFGGIEVSDARKLKWRFRGSMSDSLSCGRRFRILNVIDDVSRKCLAAVVDTSLSGTRLGRELDRVAEIRGYPCMMVSDNGTKLTSNAILKWQEDRKVSGITSRRASRCETWLR